MLTADIVLSLATALVLPFAGIVVRRRLLSRGGGAIELSLRLRSRSQGRGWVLGVGRFVGDDLQWFRVFSLAAGPRRTLSRRDLEVRSRRQPRGTESLSLLKGAEVVELRAAGTTVEVALDRTAMTGLLAWLEARPPGATLPR